MFLMFSVLETWCPFHLLWSGIRGSILDTGNWHKLMVPCDIMMTVSVLQPEKGEMNVKYVCGSKQDELLA